MGADDVPLEALRAGGDCLLYAHEDAALAGLNAIARGLRDGAVPASRVRQASDAVARFQRLSRIPVAPLPQLPDVVDRISEQCLADESFQPQPTENRDFVLYEPFARGGLVVQRLLDALKRHGAGAAVVFGGADAGSAATHVPKTARVLIIVDVPISRRAVTWLRETYAGRDLLFICPGIHTTVRQSKTLRSSSRSERSCRKWTLSRLCS